MKNLTRIFPILIYLLLFNEASNFAFQNPSPVQQKFYAEYDVKFYHINISVDNGSPYFQANTTILIQLLQDNPDSISFDLKNELKVDSVFINGVRRSFHHANDILSVATDSLYSAAKLLNVDVFYSLSQDLPKSDAAVFNKQIGWGRKITYSLTEPFTSRSWYPCKEDLGDKADSVYVFVTTQDSLKAGSNGLLTRTVLLPGNKVRYEWKSHYPIAFYLISFAVGNYLDYNFNASTADGDSVFVQNYIYNDSSYFADNKSRIKTTAKLIELYSREFGPYPFKNEKYGHCDAPIGGGMEHQTMTTIDGFNFELVAHELTHQWFGDYVTCADWRDIWVNEGFASYGELLAYQAFESDSVVASWLSWAHSLAQTISDGTIYIPDQSVNDDNRIFNYNLTYRKGASIIHMIRHELQSDSLFFTVLKTYLKEFAYSSATGDDFRKVLEQVSGKDFKYFFNQWYFGAGYPIFNIRWEIRNDSLIIYSDQTPSAPGTTDFFKMLVDFRIEYFGGDTLVHFEQNHPSEIFAIPFNQRVYRINPDPDQWLLNISRWRFFFF